ncbi:hypothetical protein D3C80_737940 [compost metagenome]
MLATQHHAGEIDGLIVAVTEVADALGGIGGVDHHHQAVDGGIQIRTRARTVVHAHHDKPRHLIRPGVAEVDPLDHLSPAAKTQQTGGLTQLGQLLVEAHHLLHLGRPRRGVLAEHLLDQRVVGLVLVLARQALVEVVVAEGVIDPVVPVTGVVAVPLHGLGAQQLDPGMGEGNALPQHGGGQRHPLHPHQIGPSPRLVDQVVEQGLVVVLVDVVLNFGRILGIARRLTVVVDVGPLLRHAVLVGQHELLEVARHAEAHQV